MRMVIEKNVQFQGEMLLKLDFFAYLCRIESRIIDRNCCPNRVFVVDFVTFVYRICEI